MNNSLIIAAAGSGKTTYIVKKALEIHNDRVLITTFTEANEREICKKIIEFNGCIPANLTVQTWFSFLLQHGVKPYQSLIYEGKINGLKLVDSKSGLKYKSDDKTFYYGEKDIPEFYFNHAMQIYSDKIAKFVYKVNQLSQNLVLNRLNRIYQYIFIDEVQDFAGYDLKIMKDIMKSSSELIMVGDPRQVTYYTHTESQYKQYRNGKIEEFIKTECKDCSIIVDKKSLVISHRNNKDICEFANQIYPEYEPCGYDNKDLTGHDGIYFVRRQDVELYLKTFKPIQLRDSVKTKVYSEYAVINFGDSKGLTFDRVLIYPTQNMLDWIINHSNSLPPQSKAKLYVAVTRAKYSVGIIFDNKKEIKVDGINTFEKEEQFL